MWREMERGCPAISHDNLAVSYPKTIDELLESARQGFYDVNETDNLLNILEAGQTLDSMVSLGRMLSQLRKNTSSLWLGKKASVPSHKFKGRDVSNLYLGWSFGFAPLLADARKIARSLPKIRKNLRDLAKRATRPVSVVRSSQGNITFSPTSGSGYGSATLYTDYEHWWTERINLLKAPIRYCGVHGTRSIEYKSSVFQEADYLLSRYIATGPVSLAWEKVKFSFAADWFINLTGTIDLLDNALTGMRKKIDYAWSSEGYRALVQVNLTQYGDRNFPYDGKQIALCDIRKYHRKPELVSYTPTWSGRFGKKQTALSVALLHQMVANLKR